MNYIQWLLKEEEDMGSEGMEWAHRIPHPRKAHGLPRLPRARALGRETAEPLSLDTRDKHAGRATEGLDMQSNYVLGRDMSLPKERVYQSILPLELDSKGAMETQGELAQAELTQKSRQQSALRLYGSVRRAEKAEQYLRKVSEQTRVVSIKEELGAGAKLLSPWELDHCFERESRRYDHDFSLL